MNAATTPTGRVQFGLQGRAVVLTDAAQSMGAACAHRLALDGASVSLWDVDEAGAKRPPDELETAGLAAHAHHCDVACKPDADEALQATITALGRVDALVNNAGIFRAAEFLDVTEADWDAVIDINLKGAFLWGQAVARKMVAQGNTGAIVSMSSVNGSIAFATELARSAVLTSNATKQRILDRTPMKRLGEPEEVADVVAFLLSDSARYMTGEVMHVDGGRMALNYTVPV